MALIWQLGIDGVKLSSKLSDKEVEFNFCNPKKKIKISDQSTTTVTGYVYQHPEYRKWLDNLKKQEQKKAATQQKQLIGYLNNGILSNDRKAIKFIACTN